MKTITMIIMMFVAFNLSAGELHWITDNGNQSRLNCTIEAQSHSDKPSISEYWIDCEDNNIDANNNQNVTNKSVIYINDSPILICPMDSSIFGNANNFYMILDCRSKVFKNGFELN